ncbi:P-loop NTPase fold protein [Alkalimonas collagenimarina]|uniref:P-loop NTPase fold protein n=1 Tax=Alkalimonas collagenimarina TaxID=400390 RepID=A0ABT9H3T9_9GAMM|nr:P-loop NTPase fold protein [Alkalimonas collagenimarina]MDP4537952.1 P-loop NTPase fold protein [Alkalimonas collagenimarina]
MWSDKESKIDFLNFNEIAQSIKEIITDRNLMPISVGIFGDWGAGKSTILELTSDAIRKEQKEYIQVHFDAWTFQSYDDAKAALLETIAAKLVEKAADDKGLLKKALDFANRIDKIRFMGFMAEGAAAISGMPTFGALQKLFGMASDSNEEAQKGVGLEDVLNDAQELSKLKSKANDFLTAENKFSPPTEIREFRKSYTSLLEAFDKPLIVYIDNLDRCSPKNTISTLEAIRLFLFLPNTSFVVAADPDMIKLAVPHFHEGASLRHQIDYVDKLIQIPVHVPKPGVAEVRAYLIMLFTQDKRVPDKEFEKIRIGLEESLRLSWKQPQTSVDDLLKPCNLPNKSELRDDFKLAEQLAPILAESKNISGNPRIVKRLLNQVKMRYRTAHRRGMNLDERAVIKLVIFERCMGVKATNKLYELIDAEKGKPAFLKMLEDQESELDMNLIPKEWESELAFLDKWSELEPKFADVDLTPAVYLSRQSIPMGTANNILSGAAQALLNGLRQQATPTSSASDKLFTELAAEEYVLVMDGLVAYLRQVDDLKLKSPGIYGARWLALKDAQCKDIFKSFLGKVPKKPWINTMIKDLEGTK